MGTNISVDSITPDSGNHALPQPTLAGSELDEPDEPPSSASSSGSVTSMFTESCDERGDIEQCVELRVSRFHG